MLATLIPLTCSACERVAAYRRNATGYSDAVCSNEQCEHELNYDDLVLDEGEDAVWFQGVLCVKQASEK